jgi:hypothetical protein
MASTNDTFGSTFAVDCHHCARETHQHMPQLEPNSSTELSTFLRKTSPNEKSIKFIRVFMTFCALSNFAFFPFRLLFHSHATHVTHKHIKLYYFTGSLDDVGAGKLQPLLPFKSRKSEELTIILIRFAFSFLSDIYVSLPKWIIVSVTMFSFSTS